MAKPLKTGGMAPLEGSGHIPGANTVRIGAAAAKDVVTFTVMIRRRPDGPPLPVPSMNRAPQSGISGSTSIARRLRDSCQPR